MEFNVPQFLEIEDKIIGPFTLKQFLYLAAAGAIMLFSWYLFKFWVFILISIPTLGLALALSFLQINGRPFGQILLAFWGFISRPKIYIWGRKNK